MHWHRCLPAVTVVVIAGMALGQEATPYPSDTGHAPPSVWSMNFPTDSQFFGDVAKGLWDEISPVITAAKNQQVIAGIALVLGIASLFDGPRFFRLFITITIMAEAFFMSLHELEQTWTEGDATKMAIQRAIAAAEVSLFFGFVAYRGWEGVQLVIGLLVGLYLFPVVVWIVHHIYPWNWHMHSILTFIFYTLCALLGIWMVHDKRGGPRVFAVVAPLLGSSLIVAAGEYMAFASSVAAGKLVSNVVPTVFEFWYMVAFPTESKAVGFFDVKDPEQSGKLLANDRVVATCLTLLLFMFGSSFQLKSLKAAKVKAREGLSESLLEDSMRSQL